jgi:hypothetical protein
MYLPFHESMTLDIMGREDQKIYFKNRNMRHILHILC